MERSEAKTASGGSGARIALRDLTGQKPQRLSTGENWPVTGQARRARWGPLVCMHHGTQSHRGRPREPRGMGAMRAPAPDQAQGAGAVAGAATDETIGRHGLVAAARLAAGTTRLCSASQPNLQSTTRRCRLPLDLVGGKGTGPARARARSDWPGRAKRGGGSGLIGLDDVATAAWAQVRAAGGRLEGD